MASRSKYSRETRERAVRLVWETEGKHGSQWAAICSVAEKVGCTSETRRKWVRRAERKADGEWGLVHHSDRGSQDLSIRYTERLALAGIEPSVGSRGDSYTTPWPSRTSGSTRPS